MSYGEGCFGNFAPRRKRALLRSVALGGRCIFWTRDVEKVGDVIVDGQEPFLLRPRRETLHEPLAAPCRLMRILGSIVQAFVLEMLNLKAHLHPPRAAGFKRRELKVPAGAACWKSERRIVGDHDPRRSAYAFQELCQETLRAAHHADHAQAWGKAKTGPDRAGDDPRREPMTATKRGVKVRLGSRLPRVSSSFL
jgi:hypothetical protein